MFNGPLSERIDWITGKLLGEYQAKSKEKKPKKVPSAPKPFEGENLWEATQLRCPIPPRNPDGWTH